MKHQFSELCGGGHLVVRFDQSGLGLKLVVLTGRTSMVKSPVPIGAGVD